VDSAREPVFISPTLAAAVWADSACGLTYARIVPESVRIVAPGPPRDFTAARKIGFIPREALGALAQALVNEA
jgi:hypothetical protein